MGKYTTSKNATLLNLTKWLDRSSEGPKWLNDVPIATTIANKIHELNSKRYRLIAYCYHV